MPADLAEELKRDHLRLVPAIEQLRSLADRNEDMSQSEAATAMDGIDEFLAGDILPHEREDERELYPKLAALLKGDEPLAAMSRTHQEIFHLVRQFQTLHEDIPSAGPDREDLADIRRVLYALHAVLRLNFAQEEELYLSLDDEYLTRGRGSATEPAPAHA
jgi:hypothetical protein